MMMNGMYGHFSQSLGEVLLGIGVKVGGQHDDVGRAKIERFFGRSRAVRGIELEVLLHNPDKSVAQLAEGRELTHVHARQLFRQTGLVTGSKRPVREVVGKSLANKVVFLQSAEGVFKDGVVRTDAQGSQKLRERIRFLRGDAQKMRRGIEVKPLHRRS